MTSERWFSSGDGVYWFGVNVTGLVGDYAG